MDIPSVRTVINMTLPNNYKSYVHRVGRTARAGAKGKSISLVGESERNMLKVSNLPKMVTLLKTDDENIVIF